MKTELDLKMKLEVATFKIALSVAIKNEEMVECSQTRLRNETGLPQLHSLRKSLHVQKMSA